jgi:hypothetical protein
VITPALGQSSDLRARSVYASIASVKRPTALPETAMTSILAYSVSYRVHEFIQRHMPIFFDNPTFCLLVVGMAVAMLGLYWFTRHKAALVVSAASLLYFVPFVRL